MICNKIVLNSSFGKRDQTNYQKKEKKADAKN